MATKKRKKLTATQKEKNRLARKIRSNVKELNRQLGIINREIERGSYAPYYETVDTTLETMRQLTKTKSATKFATGRLSHMSLADLQELESYSTHVRTQKKVFNTTRRRDMFNRAWQTMNSRYFSARDENGNLINKPLSRKEYRMLLTLFSNKVIGEFKENRMLGSTQLMDMVAEYGDSYSTEDIVNAFRDVSEMFNMDTTRMTAVFKNNPKALRDTVNTHLKYRAGKIDEDEMNGILAEYKDKYNL